MHTSHQNNIIILLINSFTLQSKSWKMSFYKFVFWTCNKLIMDKIFFSIHEHIMLNFGLFKLGSFK